MTTNIAQSLLSDTIHSQCHLVGQTPWQSIRPNVYAERLGTRDTLTLGFQRLGQAEILDYRGMQPVR
jgi:hypothetical protein